MKKTLLWVFFLLVGATAFIIISGEENVIAQEFGDDQFDQDLEDEVEVEVDDLTDVEGDEADQQDEADDQDEKEDSSTPPPANKHQR